MLYDPKWDAKPSLSGFIAWLKRQDPRGRYDYFPADTCAIGQYLKSIGTTYRDAVLSPEGCNMLVEWNGAIAYGQETFGAALRRARLLAFCN